MNTPNSYALLFLIGIFLNILGANSLSSPVVANDMDVPKSLSILDASKPGEIELKLKSGNLLTPDKIEIVNKDVFREWGGEPEKSQKESSDKIVILKITATGKPKEDVKLEVKYTGGDTTSETVLITFAKNLMSNGFKNQFVIGVRY